MSKFRNDKLSLVKLIIKYSWDVDKIHIASKIPVSVIHRCMNIMRSSGKYKSL